MIQSVSKTYQAHTSTNGSLIITAAIQRFTTVKTKRRSYHIISYHIISYHHTVTDCL